MSTTKATFVPEFPSNSATVKAHEERLWPALPHILDPPLPRKMHVPPSRPNTRLDELGINTPANLSLIEKTWLLLQSQFEQQLAVIQQLIDRKGFPPIGPVIPPAAETKDRTERSSEGDIHER